MFKTFPDYEHHVPRQLAPYGEQLWMCVNRLMESPWLHFSYFSPKNSCSETVFVERVSAFIKMLPPPESDVVITELQLVSPGWINGTKEWRMDPLAEILGGDDGQATVFVLRDGRRLTFSLSGRDEKKMKPLRSLYRFAGAKASTKKSAAK